MSSKYFTKDYSKQFRQEHIEYPSTEEYQHGNLLFRQFKGSYSARTSLAVAVTKKLYHTQLIYKTLIRLENKYTPDIGRLLVVAKAVRNEFRGYALNEPRTSNYYRELVVMLDNFYDLANETRKGMQGRVSGKLKKIYKGIHKKTKSSAFNGACVNPIVEQTDSHLKHIHAYYKRFLVIRQRETACGNKEAGLTTAAAEYLSILIAFIEKVIAGIEDTRDRLLKWQKQMNVKEEQELYN